MKNLYYTIVAIVLVGCGDSVYQPERVEESIKKSKEPPVKRVIKQPDVQVARTLDLGNGWFLGIVPAEYTTEKSDELIKEEFYEYVVVPATYETITKQIVTQEAFTKIVLIPPVLSADGSQKTTARISLKEVPSVTKQVSYRRVKTPAHVLKKQNLSQYLPPNILKLVRPARYTVRNADGKVIKVFSDANAVADYLNAQP